MAGQVKGEPKGGAPRQRLMREACPSECDRREEGMVTVELALGLAAVFTVVLALILALAAGVTHAQTCHAARVAARAHSLGESPAAAAMSVTSKPVSVSVGGGTGWFTATAVSPALNLGGWKTLPIRCEVRAYREPHLSWGNP